MKKLLKGFTLAEVLITLTIIGVISAIALPSINSSTTSAQIGPQVGKAVSTLESANKMWLTQNNARRFSADCVRNTAAYIACIEPFVNGQISNIKINDNNNDVLITSDGIYFFGPVAAGRNMLRNAGGGTGVMIDINGDKRPNLAGFDRFRFYILRNNGNVVAEGSREYASIQNQDVAAWEREGEGGCATPEQYEAKSRDADTRWNCTGSIVDNNYRVLYMR